MKLLMRPPRGQGARRLWDWGTARAAAGALAAALALAGCASSVTELPDSPPSGERSVSAYPAVHDVPPTRAEKTLTDEEQVELQRELAEAGQSLPAKVEEIERADPKPAPAPATRSAPATRPAPADPKRQPGRQAAGTRANP